MLLRTDFTGADFTRCHLDDVKVGGGTVFDGANMAGIAIKDTVLSKFGLSEPPLQTLLTTSLKPFAQIRRERSEYFGAFPTDDEFRARVVAAANDC